MRPSSFSHVFILVTTMKNIPSYFVIPLSDSLNYSKKESSLLYCLLYFLKHEVSYAKYYLYLVRDWCTIYKKETMMSVLLNLCHTWLSTMTKAHPKSLL